MVKIKTFRWSMYDEDRLDAEVNEFLKQKITVRSISHSTTESGSSTYLITQIAYEDGVKEGSRWMYSEPDLFAVSKEA